MNDKNDVTHMQSTVSFLASKGLQKVRLSLRDAHWSSKFRAAGFLLLVLAISRDSQAAVSVQVPASLQADFIATTTTQWNAEVKPGIFSGDSKIVITSKKGGVIPVPIADATALEACMAHGVGDGMEFERRDNTYLIYGAQAKDALSGTCGGTPVSQLTSTSTIMGACMQTYNISASTISLRWGYIFDSEGRIVNR